MIARHEYPAVWYTDAARNPGAGVGPAWSPLLGTRFETLEPAYQQAHPGDVARQLELVAVERPGLPALENVFDEEDTELFFVVGGAVALAFGVLGLTGTFARRRLSGAGRL